MRNIPALTGIRGVAALLVLLFHLPTPWRIPIVRNGALGVDLFFILSGFILMHVHRELGQPTLERIRSFFVLRFFRVYPLHFVVLMTVLIVVLAFPAFVQWERRIPGLENAYSLAGFFQTLTLTNRVGLPDLGQWNGPSWSLSSEVLGYLFFPALVPMASHVRSSSSCYVFAASSLAIFCVFRILGHDGVARMFFTFPVGIALARAHHLSPIPERRAGILAIVSFTFIVGCLLVDKIATMSVFGFAGLILALATDAGPISQALGSPVIMFLGKISFSLYLTHHVLLLFMTWIGGNGLWWLVSLVIESLLLATITHYLIEAPSHRFGRRISRERQVAIAAA